jgi:hypothetical protein
VFFRLHPTIKRVKAELNVDTINLDLLNLIQQMLSKDLTIRPKNVESVLAHNFFSNDTESTGLQSQAMEEEFKNIVNTINASF